jgi:beta-lactamase class A
MWKDQIEKECKQVDGICGVVVKNIVDGQAFLFDAETIFPAASVIKLFILWDLIARTEAQELAYDEVITLKEEQRVPGFGVLKELHNGLNLTLLDLAMLMIIISDNIATNMLIDRLGMSAINERITKLGAGSTLLQRKMMDEAAKKQGLDNLTCPLDVLLLLQRVATATGLHHDSSLRYVDILKRQQCNNKLPALLPSDAVIAHKTGDLPGTEHDAGILYTPCGPVVVVVMTKNLKDNRDGVRLNSSVGKLVFDHFSLTADHYAVSSGFET